MINTGMGLNDMGKQGGSLGNLDDLGVVLGLSGDPGCGRSISDLTFIHRKKRRVTYWRGWWLGG